jgi:hypothetical protein
VKTSPSNLIGVNVDTIRPNIYLLVLKPKSKAYNLKRLRWVELRSLTYHIKIL